MGDDIISTDDVVSGVMSDHTPDPEAIDEIADGDDVPPSEEEVTQDPAPYEEGTV